MTALTVGTTVRESLTVLSPNLRVSNLAVETLYSLAKPTVQVSATVMEALVGFHKAVGPVLVWNGVKAWPPMDITAIPS